MPDEGGESGFVCWNEMVDVYLKFGELEAAKELFEHMPGKNVGSCYAMILKWLGNCSMKQTKGMAYLGLLL